MYDKSKICPVIIYGAGEIGEGILYNKLSEYHIPVLKFCDRDKWKQGTKCCGIEVISPENLKNEYYGINVIVSIYKHGQEIAEDLEKSKIVKNAFYYKNLLNNNLALQLIFNINGCSMLYYIIESINIKKRHVMFYGQFEDVVTIMKKFELLDITNITGIAVDNFINNKTNFKFINKYDLVNINLDQCLIMVLTGCEESAKHLINEFNLDASRFIKNASTAQLYYSECYDPNLGYNSNNGIIKLKTKNNVNPKRVGILGASGAAADYIVEKSWAAYLIDEAETMKINLEVYVGAVEGNTASLALIKLIRDMSLLNLDVIIYYDGLHKGIDKNYFIHGNQKFIFDNLNKNADTIEFLRDYPRKNVYYGSGLKTAAEDWIYQSRLMNAVCNELRIKFYAVIRPMMLLKKPLSVKDIEHLEHIYKNLSDSKNSILKPLLTSIINEAQKNPCSYIFDFSDTFDNLNESIYIDGTHVFDHGNEIIAKRIFRLIENDLK